MLYIVGVIVAAILGVLFDWLIKFLLPEKPKQVHFVSVILAVLFLISILSWINNEQEDDKKTAIATVPVVPSSTHIPFNVENQIKEVFGESVEYTDNSETDYSTFDYVIKDGERLQKISANVLYVTPFPENDNDYYLVVLNYFFEGMACHVCPGSWGYIVFKLVEDKWQVYSMNDDLLSSGGTFGETPQCKLIQIGAKHYGLLFEHSEMHQGYEGKYLFIYAFLNNQFQLVLETDWGENNYGAVLNPEDRWGYTAQYEFDQQTKKDFYDLNLTYFGKLEDQTSLPKIIKKEHLIFNGEKYAPLP